jgi:hypothetical protein
MTLLARKVSTDELAQRFLVPLDAVDSETRQMVTVSERIVFTAMLPNFPTGRVCPQAGQP